VDIPAPRPGKHDILLKVLACGLCRTDLHIIDGELSAPKLPLVLGHQIVGRVAELGDGVEGMNLGDRIGVPWLGSTCGTCRFCVSSRENLCDHPEFTGYTRDGGLAEMAVADYRYCFPIPDSFGNVEAAPLLCAGFIGYRSMRLAGADAKTIGIYGFGSAAHLVTQVAQFQGRDVFAFTRPGDDASQAFARELGAVWAGSVDEQPPELLDAAIIFAPAGELVPQALKVLRKGGTVVCGGIHMSDIPSFRYSLLWEERSIQSVANLTRADGQELLELAAQIPIHTHCMTGSLHEAPEMLDRIRRGDIQGSAVVTFN